ncbi:PREDICTED: uncharacterized protein LOC109179802 [Ipomoea nil]|uniref:uncharacterized protein LOC109179802 n=1 Tax=Ipomoea nil TaxID=35883 RepID=UPI000901E88B|nr:PREDICTED: uncharacterized protein LOC109179802 [Ipomoea nil]
MFIQRDADLILSIPVSLENADMWCWRGDIRGVYSVRGGYRLLNENNHNLNTPFTAWKELWRLKIPPKFANFIWRCARCILPTLVSLSSRGMNIDTLCPICHACPESLNHLLLECSQVTGAWGGILDSTDLHADLSFEAWLSELFKQSDHNKLLRCIATCWCIWKRRNEWVWSRKMWPVEEIIRMATSCFIEWQTQLTTGSHGLGHIHNTQTRNVHESSHVAENIPPSTLVVEVDAALPQGGTDGFYGIVCRNSNGGFVAARSGPIR